MLNKISKSGASSAVGDRITSMGISVADFPPTGSRLFMIGTDRENTEEPGRRMGRETFARGAEGGGAFPIDEAFDLEDVLRVGKAEGEAVFGFSSIFFSGTVRLPTLNVP